MTRFIHVVVAALILALSSTGFAAAQPAPAAPKFDPAGPIDEVRLGEILEGLGLDFTRGTYQSGAAYYDTKMTTTVYEFPVRIGFSPNKRVVWLSVGLSTVPSDTPAEKLRGLLEAINNKTGKLQFRLVGDQLKADQPIDNFAITPARMRRELNDFTTTLQETFKVWDSNKWETRPPVEP